MTHEQTTTSPAAQACGISRLVPSAVNRAFIVNRWEVLSLVKSVARALNLGEREITVLSAHLSVLAKGPVRSDGVLVSWAGLPALLDRANCMDERRFRRGETRLEQAGLIRRKLSGNSRRYAVRNGKGTVVDAYGIDLRPLFDGLPDLLDLKARLDEDAARLNALRSRISARLSEARRQLAEDGVSMPDWLEELTTAGRNTLRRASVSLAEAAAMARHVDDTLDRELAHHTVPEGNALPDRPAEDAGQNVRHSESLKKEIIKPSGQISEDPVEVWNSHPTLGSFYNDPPRTSRDLASRLFTIGGFLGLSKSLCLNAARRLTLPQLARTFEELCKHSLEIKHPDAYLRRILANPRHADSGGLACPVPSL